MNDTDKKQSGKVESEKIQSGKAESGKAESGKVESGKILSGGIQETKLDWIAESAFGYYAEDKRKYTLEDYYALPDERRVELIDGSFYDMAAPTIAHQMAGLYIYRVLADYISSQNGACVPLAAPVDVQLDCDNDTMVQPDVLVVCDRNKLLNRCVYGAPDFIVEVMSPSTSRKDSGIKLAKYRAAGVREYWMVDLDRKIVLVYEFEKADMPVIYGMDQEIPAGIFEDGCRIDFSVIYAEIQSISPEK